MNIQNSENDAVAINATELRQQKRKAIMAKMLNLESSMQDLTGQLARPSLNLIKEKDPVEHDTEDDDTASMTSKSSESPSEKNSLENEEQQEQDDETKPSKPIKKLSMGNLFRANVKKLQTLVAIKHRFGIEASELVRREKVVDQTTFQRRSMMMDLTDFIDENSDIFDEMMVYDWDMPLGHEPPAKGEVINVKSAIKTEKTNRSVRWPSRNEKPTTVVGYDEWMLDRCFYSAEDIDEFHYEKYLEDHPYSEEEWYTDDEEWGYDEYYAEEEEVYEDQPPMSRRSSL